MDRRLARKEAFGLLFEYSFQEEKTPQVIFDHASQARDFEPDEFVSRVVEGVISNLTELDQIIEAHLKDWRKNRLSRVALTILRMAVYEIQYMDDVPNSVSINEAVELAKTFGNDKDAPFVNGVLGNVVRNNGLEQ